MEACTRIASCPLFPLFTIQASLAVWKMRYCEGDFSGCERYKLAREMKPIPTNLLPNGKMLAVAPNLVGPEDLGKP